MIDQTITFIAVAIWIVALVISMKEQLVGASLHAMVSLILGVYLGTNGFTNDATLIYSILGVLLVGWSLLYFYIAYKHSSGSGSK